MKLTTFRTGWVGWDLGSCSSAQSYSGPKQYTERCCLAPGEYTLTCKAGEGINWRGGFMEIQRHKYCDDFIGYKAMQKVTISGIDMNFKGLF